ncbi:Monocarboxylate transporter 12 [Liparis tanakae]|uniref:Monocarboxylate transporter 12 n=1 Tax=Liparis tanakae TaxID=230148 RepID=A0A4Z2E305_9TELE|nr:Monocarboxylate transporter 12 [Liparis tanakae]
MEGLCCLLAPLLASFSLLVPFAVVYGYFDGAYVALIPVVTAEVVGARSLPSALGVVYFLHAIPYLVSPPIGGWLVDVTGSYAATFFFSGVSLLSSAAVMAAIVWMRRRRPAPEAPPPRPSDQSEAGCRSAASSRPIGSTDGGDEARDWPAEKR